MLPPKILFITPSLSKGGAETQLLKVARFLNSKNYRVMIISLKPIKEFSIDIEKEGIQLLMLNNWTSAFFSNCSKLFKSVRDFQADVVVAFMFIAIIFSRILKLFFGFKLISTIRISVINGKWFIPFKVTSLLDDGVVYNSKASKQNFERRKLVSKPGLVIYNGISIPPIKSVESENSFKTFVWTCIGHFRWNKDYYTLFKAIAILKDKNFRVNILGGLNNETWPFKMIEELGIEQNVRILGFKPNATEYLEDADAFVLSSFSEGMPNAILEAMAHCKPIVATDIDGNHEVVSDAGCGFLTELSNAEDLAEKMLKMMELSESARYTLGHAGRRFIETNFSEEKVMQDWQNVINQYTDNSVQEMAFVTGS